MAGVYLHPDGYVISDKAQAWRAEREALAKEFASDEIERRYRETMLRERIHSALTLGAIEAGTW